VGDHPGRAPHPPEHRASTTLPGALRPAIFATPATSGTA